MFLFYPDQTDRIILPSLLHRYRIISHYIYILPKL